jgi:hypothetical protein
MKSKATLHLKTGGNLCNLRASMSISLFRLAATFFVGHPTEILQEIQTLKEHNDYIHSRNEAQPRGRRIYRDCYNGCPAYQVFDMSREMDSQAFHSLSRSCASCVLLPGPSPEVNTIIQLSIMPDQSISWKPMPYWLAQGIGAYRAMHRGL